VIIFAFDRYFLAFDRYFLVFDRYFLVFDLLKPLCSKALKVPKKRKKEKKKKKELYLKIALCFRFAQTVLTSLCSVEGQFLAKD